MENTIILSIGNEPGTLCGEVLHTTGRNYDNI